MHLPFHPTLPSSGPVFVLDVSTRDECLNEHWFITMTHARSVIEAWRIEYTERTHSLLGNLTPQELRDAHASDQERLGCVSVRANPVSSTPDSTSVSY